MDINAVKESDPVQQPLRQGDVHHHHAGHSLSALIPGSKQTQHGEGFDPVVDG